MNFYFNFDTMCVLRTFSYYTVKQYSIPQMSLASHNSINDCLPPSTNFHVNNRVLYFANNLYDP